MTYSDFKGLMNGLRKAQVIDIKEVDLYELYVDYHVKDNPVEAITSFFVSKFRK